MKNPDKTYIELARVISGNSRAVRLKVGAVIVKDGQIISDGYNGTPYGMNNVCEELYDLILQKTTPIDSVEEAERLWDEINGGKEYRLALASKPDVVHAELNAILKCARHSGGAEGATLYVTDSPCYQCALAIIQAGIKRVVYDREYRITDGIELLKREGVKVERYGTSV